MKINVRKLSINFPRANVSKRNAIFIERSRVSGFCVYVINIESCRHLVFCFCLLVIEIENITFKRKIKHYYFENFQIPNVSNCNRRLSELIKKYCNDQSIPQNAHA